jgi:thiopeptide-type bacteriocin biosynthesis protein
LPGDRWATAKLYGSSSSLETVLRDKLDGLLGSLPPHGWFFIRYADPDVHLRVRFRPEEPADDGELRRRVEAWAAELEASGWIRRFVWDTYDRETARYGGDETIAEAEHFFGADSRFAIATRNVGCGCAHLAPVPAPALFSGCALLTSLGLSAKEATAHVLEPLHRGRLHETGQPGEASAYLSKIARDHRATLRAIASLDGHAPDCPVRPFEDAWFAAGQRLGAALRGSKAHGALVSPLATIAQSLLHMHYNGIAVGAPRREELALANLSIRIFRERAARGRSGGREHDG